MRPVACIFMAMVACALLGGCCPPREEHPAPAAFEPIDWAEAYAPHDKRRNRSMMPKIK